MAINLSASVNEKLVASLLTKLRKQLVFGATTDGKYVSGLKRGSSYKIPTIDAVNVGTYTGAAITRQSGTDTGTNLLIDQYKYFDVALDAVDANEAEAKLADFIDEGAYALADTFDQYIASKLVAGAGTTNADVAGIGVDGTPITVDETNVIDYIGLLVQGLHEANASIANSAIVLPAKQAIALQNARGTGGSDMGAGELKTGMVDKLYGVDIYTSNNCHAGSTSGTAALAYERRALKWLDSMNDMIIYQPDETFENAAKTLHVYGAVVPATLADAVVLGYVA